MRRKRKKQGFYKTVAKAIYDGSPFDISKDTNGWTRVQELVCLFILRELNEADRYKIWPEYIQKVTACFWPAVHYINDNPDDIPEYRNIHVWIWGPEKKRNNEFVSLKAGYRNGKERNTERLIRKIEKITRVVVNEIKKTNPDKLTDGRGRIIGLFE